MKMIDLVIDRNVRQFKIDVFSSRLYISSGVRRYFHSYIYELDISDDIVVHAEDLMNYNEAMGVALLFGCKPTPLGSIIDLIKIKPLE